MMSAHPRALHLCARCLLASAAIATGIIASFAYLPLDLGRLFTLDAAHDLGGFFFSFFPPDLSSAYVAKVGTASLETLAVSAVGTAIAAAFGVVLALPASGRHGETWRRGTRFLLNLLRSIPELVWAAVMVLAAGLGPFAGALALAAHTTGVLGRLFAEALENAPPTPAQALVDSGAAPAVAFLYGTVPAILPQLLSYTLYRWEINIRMAAILGFVGAGGLGQMLYFELSLLHNAQACTVIIGMLALAALVDAASATVRNTLTSA